MRIRFFAATASIFLAPLGAVGDSEHGWRNTALTVRTTSGIYTGLVNTTAPDVNQWLGIPYGRPPLGTRRFLPPEKAPYYGTADAKAYKPICFQDSGSKNNVFWQLVPEYQNTDPQNEDCLYLNIWAPRKPIRKNLPVIIWICGGGFKEGGGHALYMIPDKWIQRTQTHLVVTINYRLNIFGFPGSPAATKNAGLFDVRLAIEWLRDNIEAFGGDPSRMILYGQSAGANIVLMYAYANPHNAIVRGFIASSSGTPTSNAVNSSNFHIVAQAAGCANMSATAELACMQNVDPLILQKKVDEANPSPFRGLFRPLADNITAFSNLTDRLEKGLVSNLPLIAGFTYNEPAAFLDFDPSFKSPPPPSVPGTSGLACGIKTESINRLAYGLTTYRYLFSGNFSNTTPRYWLGGMHESDLPLVFGTHSEFRGNSTDFEWQTSFAMEDFWVSFATNPSTDPHHLNQIWPKFTAINGQVVVFGNATGPMGRASYIAPVELADKYSDPC